MAGRCGHGNEFTVYSKYKYTYYQNTHRNAKTPHIWQAVKTDINEVVTDGIYFLPALLADPIMNDSKLMIVLFVLCLSVCVCP